MDELKTKLDIVYDGVVLPAPDAESQTFVGGFFRLLFNDGRSLYGAYNFNVLQ